MELAPAPRFIPRRILVPLDFSPSSDAALEMATDLAQHFHAALHLVHVVPMFPLDKGTEFFSGVKFFDNAALLEGVKTNTDQHLAPCLSALISRGIEASSSIEVGNDVAGNIVIEREHIDMVVISTHGISGWHPVIFGSVAEKVIKLVKCPLLLLRSVKAPGNP
ncbi:MAG: universal stress protein [Acidobacteriaceae bacterium]